MRTKFSWIQVVVVLILAVVVLLLVQTQLVRSFLGQILSGPAASGTSVARETRSFIDLIRSIRSLHQENGDLKAEKLRLQAELEQLEEVRHENEVLRQELGFTAERRAEFTLIPSQIIGRSPSSFLQFIILDVGEDDGLVMGQAVVSQGFLVGRVIEVDRTTSKVQLITASRSQIPITLASSRAVGLLKGGLAGLTGEELPLNLAVQAGESVVTNGLGDLVPADLPVGSVEKSIETDSDIVQRVSIHSPIEFGKLESVIVLARK